MVRGWKCYSHAKDEEEWRVDWGGRRATVNHKQLEVRFWQLSCFHGPMPVEQEDAGHHLWGSPALPRQQTLHPSLLSASPPGQFFLSTLAMPLFPIFGDICYETSIGKGKFSYFGHLGLTLGEANHSMHLRQLDGMCPSRSEDVVLSDALVLPSCHSPSSAEPQEMQFTTKYQIKERQAFTFYISVYLQLV